MYLFGERIRNLGKSANIVGCTFTSILGNTPVNGLTFHLTDVSVPYAFKHLPLGFVVDPDGNLEPLRELDIDIVPFSSKRPENSFKLNLNAGRQYEFKGSIAEPIVFYSGQGWSGYLDLSYIEFKIGNRKGSGLMFSGEVYKEPKRSNKIIPLPLELMPSTVPLTVQFAEEASRFGEISGGKGSSLGRLTHLSHEEKTFIVPKGIVVTTAAYSEFLTPEILKEVKHLEDVTYGNQQGDLQAACRKVSVTIENTLLSTKICHSIIEDLKDVFGDEVSQKRFAVRSSATGEDTSAMSAAGQMDTFLGVKGFKEIFTAVKKCWASQFGHIAVEYKRRYGQVLNSPMAVVVQEMVACEVSGVLFTCDPVTNNPSVITITANYGLGETVVSGSVEPDTLKLRRKDSGKLVFDSCIIGSKHQRIVMQDSGGTVTEDLDENSKNESCLSKETAERLAKLSLKIEKYYKSSRDIEWGILNDQIYILQSRPVTNAAAESDKEIQHEFDAPLRCENEYFTVANVGEVMPGATSPLGIELSIKFFGNAIKKQALENGFTENLFKSNFFPSGVLPFSNHVHMTVVEMMTRYGLNTLMSKGFMVSIFGRVLDDPDLLRYAEEKVREGGKHSLYFRFKLLWDLFFFDFDLQKIMKKFRDYHSSFLEWNTAKETFTALLNACSDFEDAGKKKHMKCTEMSSNWNTYMFWILCQAKNDFARLLSTSSNVESANIPQAMQEVAIQIVKDIGCEKFNSMASEEAEEWLQSSTSLAGYKFRQFLNRHGHRCLKEIDVYSITWGMDPKLLIKLLQNLVKTSDVEEVKKEEESTSKILSQLQVPLDFTSSKCFLRFVLPHCRRGIRGREITKSTVIKCFDHWRQGFWRLAKQMVSEGRLPEKELLFFLTLEEINDLLNTRSPGIVQKAIHRKKLFPILDQYIFPEISKGIPKPLNYEEESSDSYEFIADLTMKGVPVSQGVTKGFARVAMSLEEAADLKSGEVLITYSTDIGWSPYFPVISGVVTELGGLISHGAVVSREYGLPCVVGLQGACKKFHGGLCATGWKKRNFAKESRCFNHHSFTDVKPIWEPKEHDGKLMKKFKKFIEDKYNVKLDGYEDFHKWSIDNFCDFWAEMWDFIGIISSERFHTGKIQFRKLSLLLRCMRTRNCMQLHSAKFGLKKGDVVACYMSNRMEAIFAMHAVTSSSEQIQTSQSQDAFDQKDRFLQEGQEIKMLPNVKILADGLESLEKVLIVPTNPDSRPDISGIRNSYFLDEFLEMGLDADGSVPTMQFEQVSFSHPVLISYTSGTTSQPKALIHGCGILMAVANAFSINF
ncbi:putative phosphoenolpyruvate synthase [Caerostris extrusa]|uniref:Phosphoenolpyruvate synthase n=1 Tax=Caerostris extrusa TaxID=172846 RepID=A0AAV4XH60_CAEEX|nr:putative phosphoenolpyruvate synthase [Caerostris extrusa]